MAQNRRQLRARQDEDLPSQKLATQGRDLPIRRYACLNYKPRLWPKQSTKPA